MHRVNSTYPPAVVTHMSYSGLGIVRTLGRRGIPVYALDPDPGEVGMSSRFCRSMVCPSAASNQSEHLEFLIQLSRSLGEKPVLFPTGDSTLLCYAKHENVLKDYFLYTVPARGIVEQVATKDGLFRTAVKCNVPVPDTYIPTCLADVRYTATRISYPCIIKPTRSNSWHREQIQNILGGFGKVLVARSPAELMDNYSKIAAHDPDVIISEVIPGQDEELFYFVFYVSRDHKLLGRFSGKKLRIYPIHFGSASFVQSVYVEELDKLSIRFLRDLNYSGLGGIEFKRDARDGKFKLIEFNTRYGLWDVLGARCGVDLAHIAYCDAIGEKVAEKLQYRTGVKWVSLYLDTKAFLDYKREGLIGFGTWLRSLRGEKQWAVFARDDISPSLSSIVRFARNTLRRIRPWIAALGSRACSRSVETASVPLGSATLFQHDRK